METYEGMELHRTTSTSTDAPEGDFYRMVRIGDTILHRWGARGTEGSTRTQPFLTEHIAAGAYHTHYQKLTIERYDSYDRPFVLGSGYLCLPNASLLDHEQLFLRRWANYAIGIVGTDKVRSEWVLCTGLLTERGVDPGAAAILDHLMDAPHAIDSARDYIVAQAAPLARSGNGVEWYPRDRARDGRPVTIGDSTRWSIASLGQIAATDTVVVAELAAGLATSLDTGDSATYPLLLDSARRLVRGTGPRSPALV